MMALAPVHTTGVNLASVSIIIGGIVVPVFGIVAWVVQRLERNRRAAQLRTEAFVQAQVSAVALALRGEIGAVNGKLDQVANHLKAQDRDTRTLARQLQDVRERTSLIQGQLAPRSPG